MVYYNVGGDSKDANKSLIPIGVKESIGGGSSKQFFHFLQGAKSGKTFCNR